MTDANSTRTDPATLQRSPQAAANATPPRARRHQPFNHALRILLTPQQLIFDWVPDVAPTFDNFLAGTNGEVIAHLRDLADATLEVTSVLLWGASGAGKSHLLGATLGAARERGREATALGHAASLPERAVPGALYAIDDVDRSSADAQGRLFTFYNLCRDVRAQLLLASEVPAARAPLRDDLRTRIGAGLILEVEILADAGKPAALAAFANEQGFRLSDGVIDFLLRRGRRDMGALLSNLRALERYSLATKRPVTVPLVKELLGPQLTPPPVVDANPADA